VIDFSSFTRCLADLGLGSWSSRLETKLRARLSDNGHGDFPRWHQIIDGLPVVDRRSGVFDHDAIKLGQTAINDAMQASIREALLALAPWRKGPFEVCGVRIDAEWRSNLKWNRVMDAGVPIAGRNVLDVGCGNGYYALRMRGAGAKCVVGIDPTLRYVMQYIALTHFMTHEPVFVLPLRLEELPSAARAFDTTLSMGVLYHQRSPIEHLRQLRDTLRPDGQLVLETIFLPGEESYACTPPDRYARMRNVWLLPTIAELATWLDRTGFVDIEVVDQSATTSEEQRTTEWMPFDSLKEALDPADSSRTVEGWPAPRRVVVLARAP
jgi:tRNA (mo5U34)-methyltransferase